MATSFHITPFQNPNCAQRRKYQNIEQGFNKHNSWGPIIKTSNNTDFSQNNFLGDSLLFVYPVDLQDLNTACIRFIVCWWTTGGLIPAVWVVGESAK